MKKHVLNIMVLCVCLWPLSVLATSKPAEITPHIQAEQPHGKATLRYWGFDIYDVSLWMDTPEWSMQKPFALSLNYVMPLSKERMVEETIKQLQTQRQWPVETVDKFTEVLHATLPAVEKKDRLTAIYTPQKSLQLFLNGKYYSEIMDKELLPAFVNIWLGEGNDLPELRANLLNLAQ